MTLNSVDFGFCSFFSEGVENRFRVVQYYYTGDILFVCPFYRKTGDLTSNHIEGFEMSSCFSDPDPFDPGSDP